MEISRSAVLITGGRRIGAAVAEDLAGRGAAVVVGYRRSRDEAEQCVATIRERGGTAHAIQADLERPTECSRLVNEAAATLGRLDVLLNMASVYVKTPYAELTDAGWRTPVAVDLEATHHCSRAAWPHMRQAGGGRIVNFSDWVAASGRPRYRDYVPYYVAKAGVKALTEALALELAPDRILVNAIAPGPILAPPGIDDEEVEHVASATPLGRWGGPEEVVKAVRFLIETDFVTGETIRVDGGRHLR